MYLWKKWDLYELSNNISVYNWRYFRILTKLNVKSKKILTVGSSADQALNALLLGAKEVTIFDLNEEKIYEIYLSLNKYLNKDGIIQLYYLYASIYPKAFSKIVNYFFANGIIFNKLECDNSVDSVVLVKKKWRMSFFAWRKVLGKCCKIMFVLYICGILYYRL